MSEPVKEAHTPRTPESAPLKSVGIIGYGHFGKLTEELVARFAPGIDVHIFSPGAEPDEKKFFSLEEVSSSDAVVLAVPISQYENVLRHILPSLRPQSTLIDIATVKEYTAGLIKEIAPNQRFVSIHPMFGPESYKKRDGNVDGFKIVLTDSNIPKKEVDIFTAAIKHSGAEVIEMTSEEHDRELANSLFITHLIGQVLSRAGLKRTPIDTVSFGSLMDAVESVQNDAALFKDVFTYNRFCAEVLERFGLAEEEVHRLFLKSGDTTNK